MTSGVVAPAITKTLKAPILILDIRIILSVVRVTPPAATLLARAAVEMDADRLPGTATTA